MNVNKNRYFASHLKTPRGHGTWIFELRKLGITETFQTIGTFTKAVQAARKEALKIGAFEIIVMP